MKNRSKPSRQIALSTAVLGLLMSASPTLLHAKIASRGVNQSPSVDEGRSKPIVVQGNATPVVTSSQTTTKSCSDGNQVPLSLLQMITENGEGISVSGFDKNDGQKKIVLRIPEYIKACSDFKFSVIQNPSNANIGVSVENNFDYEAYYKEKSWELPSGFAKMSQNDRYEDCLKREGILVNGPDGLTIERPEYKEHNYGATVSAPIDLLYFDETKPMNIYFGSPHFLGREYGAAYKLRDQELLGDGCLRVEDIDSKGGSLYSSEDAEKARLMNICSSGNYDAIRAALSSLGNAHELRATLESALGKAASDRAREIYERLDAIEEAFKPSKEDREEGRNVGVSERSAKKLAGEYGELLSELNDIVYTPSINRMQDLLNRRELETDDAKVEAIDEQIKSLNELVGEFNKDHNKETRLGLIYDGLKEYNLSKEAEKIEGFRLKSQYFSSVYEGKRDNKRGPQLSVQDANEKIKDKLSYFKDTVMKDWEDIYLAKEGSQAPVRSAQREVNAQVARLQSSYMSFQKKEQEDYQKYCTRTWYGTVKYASRCNNFMSTQSRRYQRYLKMRERQLKGIQASNNKLISLGQYYESAQRAVATADNSFNDDPLGLYSGSYYGSDFGMDMGGDPMMNLYNMGPQYQMPQMQTPGIMPMQQMQMNQGGPQMISNPLQMY